MAESEVSFNKVDAKGLIISGVKVNEFVAYESTFTKCRFERLQVRGWSPGVRGSVYVGCSFVGCRMGRVGNDYCRFEGCSFENVVIRNWGMRFSDVVDCVFTGRIESGFFSDHNMVNFPLDPDKPVNEFRGNDFSGCELVGVDFRGGIDLSQQKLPTGPDYLYLEDGPGAIEGAFRFVEAWPDETFRKEGLVWLGIRRKQADRGQRQLFMNRNTSHRLASIWPQLCDALQGVG